MSRKRRAVGIVIMLAVSILTACASNNGNVGSAPAASTPTASAPAAVPEEMPKNLYFSEYG